MGGGASSWTRVALSISLTELVSTGGGVVGGKGGYAASAADGSPVPGKPLVAVTSVESVSSTIAVKALVLGGSAALYALGHHAAAGAWAAVVTANTAAAETFRRRA